MGNPENEGDLQSSANGSTPAAAVTSPDIEDSLNIKSINMANTGSCVATMSGVTFGSTTTKHYAVEKTERSDANSTQVTGRKINARDVQNVFQRSTTTGTVSFEQVRRIKRMHDKISDGVKWDFNYGVLLTVASIVAAIGLAIDSATTVISSMLLSPIMGPVIGMSYGLIIWDLPLIKRSARNEILSIIVCIGFGLLIALCCRWTPIEEDWPTHEMLSRATRSTFLAGFPIAFFSGCGVAISVVDESTSSLVGVAISASLLPPAVNSGMLWLMAFYEDPSYVDFSFSIGYDAKDYSVMGTFSLLLTIANVVMVCVGATLMFRMKEVLPVTKKVFWQDLKVARRIYQGRAYDSVTGEALRAEHLTEQSLQVVLS